MKGCHEGVVDSVKQMEEHEEPKTQGKPLGLPRPGCRPRREDKGGEGYDAESLVVDGGLPGDEKLVREEGETENHEPVEEPDVPVVDFHPEEEHTARDEDQTGEKPRGSHCRTSRRVSIDPFHPRHAGEHDEYNGEYLSHVNMNKLEVRGVVLRHHEDRHEPHEVPEIQDRDAYGKAHQLLAASGSVKGDEAGKEGDRGERGALEDDLE